MGLSRFLTGLAAIAAGVALATGCTITSTTTATDGGGGGGGDSGTSGGDSSTRYDTGSLNDDSGQQEAGLSDGMLFNDGMPNVDGMACVPGDAGPPPYPQRCITATDNECDGPTDQALTALGISASLLNGTGGNGFDDDCDGLVDEGCACTANGYTKDCYLVPASQIDPSTGQPVGWCTAYSKGSLDCAGVEFPHWSGVCRGAQPPYQNDVCSPGDYNCDGLQENSATMNCTCGTNVVQCPTNPVTEAPYPDPTAIPVIDGTQWIPDASQLASTANWTWTVIGGDCDNVLPHPTYAIYNQKDSTTGTRLGMRTPVVFNASASPARYQAMAGAPLISLQASTGNGGSGAKVWPAFGLSGDYIVQGEFDLGGTHYVCTQKVQVRAPGIRAELCWDTVGGDEIVNPAGNDIDLHLSRLQGVACAQKGWDQICPQGQTFEDCYYNAASGCRDFSTVPPGWGYADSAAATCTGWSSKRMAGAMQGCTNPRLDKDNITCDTTVDDPTNVNGFCGPENINLDDPNDGDSFAVAVNHYDNHGGTANAHPHVNLYCNGQRVISVGFNPVTGQTQNPLLNTPGQDSTGDFWEVGTITTHVSGGQVTSCDVQTVPSHHADQVRDGVTSPNTNGNGTCVDSITSNANPPYDYTSHVYIENQPLQGGVNGGIPTTIGGFCKH